MYKENNRQKDEKDEGQAQAREGKKEKNKYTRSTNEPTELKKPHANDRERKEEGGWRTEREKSASAFLTDMQVHHSFGVTALEGEQNVVVVLHDDVVIVLILVAKAQWL